MAMSRAFILLEFRYEKYTIFRTQKDASPHSAVPSKRLLDCIHRLLKLTAGFWLQEEYICRWSLIYETKGLSTDL